MQSQNGTPKPTDSSKAHPFMHRKMNTTCGTCGHDYGNETHILGRPCPCQATPTQPQTDNSEHPTQPQAEEERTFEETLDVWIAELPSLYAIEQRHFIRRILIASHNSEATKREREAVRGALAPIAIKLHKRRTVLPASSQELAVNSAYAYAIGLIDQAIAALDKEGL